jgi:DNA (cytosine-5)-methyltransferase 1
MNLAGSKAVEMFAGIGGFRLAADSCGIETVWANDIDPKASLIYRSRFGVEQFIEGNVETLHSTIPEHQLLTGGFPCQPFSSAGKKQGISDPRGTLFQQIVKVLRRRLPNLFILENVKRLLVMEQGGHFAAILSELARLDYQIEWRLLNAVDFGLPQNRERLIMLGIHGRLCRGRSFDYGQIRLAPPEDFARASDRALTHLHNEEKWTPIARHGSSFASWGIARESRFFALDPPDFTERRPRVFLKEVLEANPPEEFDFTESTLARISRNSEVNRYIGGVEILSNQGGARGWATPSSASTGLRPR